MSSTATDGQELLKVVKDLRSRVASSQSANGVREELIREVQGLVRDLETPWHTIQRVCGLNIWEPVVVDIAVNMGLFTALANKDMPVRAETLAKECGAELLLVQRIIRCLVALNAARAVVIDNGDTMYAATLVSRTFADPNGAAAIRSCFEFLAPGWMQLPAELKAHGFKALVSGDDTVYNKVYNAPGKTLWDILSATPYVPDFGRFMTVFNGDHQDWLEIYPADERLVAGAAAADDAVFMVDVGGYTGSQAVAFRQRFPQTPGRFLVQDLPQMLPSPPPDGIDVIAHDFFQPQPPAVHGARLYYMRFISHDWSQERLVQILSNIRDAMSPGYSKLIIHDWIVPEQDPPVFMTTQDLNMMALGGGEERAEARYREAVEAAGLKVTGIWDPKDGKSEGVVECERA